MQDGAYTIVRPSFDRRVQIDGYAALPTPHLMTALIELDVTDALAAIAAMRRGGVRVSLFAFVVRAIAQAIAEHPDLNLVQHGRRFLRFADVDVGVPVEVHTPDGDFPRQVILRRAQARTAVDLYAELERAKQAHAREGALGREDRWLRRVMRVIGWLPRFVRRGLLRLSMRSGFLIKRSAGTTQVTSVGKFAALPGFGFSFTTGPRAASFAIGSVVERPWIVGGKIAPRSILALAILINHDFVDGAPAARFAVRLQELVEGAVGLDRPAAAAA